MPATTPPATISFSFAVVLGLSYKWLATGLGAANVASKDGNLAALRLDCFMQTGQGERLLLPLRKLSPQNCSRLLDLAHSLVRTLSRAMGLAKIAQAPTYQPYTCSILRRHRTPEGAEDESSILRPTAKIME